MNVEMEYGLNPNTNEPVHIDVSPNGLNCGLVCGSCKERLVAVQGKQRAWHFRHHVPSTCQGWTPHDLGVELLYHRACKAVEGENTLLVEHDCRECAERHITDFLTLHGKASAVFRETQVRNRVSMDRRFTPDVMLEKRHEQVVLMEVVVTNPPSGILDLGFPTVEVPIESEADARAIDTEDIIRGGCLYNHPCPNRKALQTPQTHPSEGDIPTSETRIRYPHPHGRENARCLPCFDAWPQNARSHQCEVPVLG